MPHYIYKITNVSNGKYYIGKTNDVDKRWYHHVYCALVDKDDTYFYNAIRKYGAKDFTVETIEECEAEDTALIREAHWIRELNARDRNIGYNMTDGGDGISGLKHTEETKKKIAAAHLGKKHTEETKVKMSDAHKGQIVSKETREKISKANSGENNGMFGKSISDDTRKKLSDFQSTRPRKLLSEGHKQKNSDAAKKQDHSYRIPQEIKDKVIIFYSSGNYTKQKIADDLGLKYNSVVKIIRTNKPTY